MLDRNTVAFTTMITDRLDFGVQCFALHGFVRRLCWLLYRRLQTEAKASYHDKPDGLEECRDS